jgi:O-6-methylguanine DNA methyltransferase
MKAKNKNTFSEQVYAVVKQISRGKTMSYKEIARAAGRPRAWRAVGNILNKNKNPLIPCHRVIRSDGKPGGYRGGRKKKIILLKKERAEII